MNPVKHSISVTITSGLVTSALNIFIFNYMQIGSNYGTLILHFNVIQVVHVCNALFQQ